jgi:putative transposase
MDEKQREGLALFRYGVIGSLISGELRHGDLKRRVRELSQQRYSIPFSHRTHIGQGTIMEWLSSYRTGGFEALKPRKRSSLGMHPSISKELGGELVAMKKQQPKIAVLTILRLLREQGAIKHGEVSVATAYRYLAHAGLMQRPASKTGNEKLRFCHQFSNDCWQGDVMHGPYIKDGQSPTVTARKTYLVAFIDDASRLIVGAQFFFSEATVNIKTVLRNAVLTYGVPRKLYLDNGKNFCADDIRVACASMNCALIHTTPYYPEGKGKIERFFKTVRSMFLTCVGRVYSLMQLNERLSAWLQNQYNRRPHDGIGGQQPLDVFLRNVNTRIRPLPAHIDPVDLFCLKENRQVAKDGTFRINNILYETQEHLIGRTVTIHYDRDESTHRVKVFDGDIFVHETLPIDFLANAKAKRKPLEPNTNNNPEQLSTF